MSVTIGTPFKSSAVKVLLCGSGELGKEVVLELQRYGVEVIAADAYPDAPAMQVADRAHVLSMLDGDALRKVIEEEKPDFVVPEVEAIATDTLAELEREGVATIIPTARATQLTMNREGIRRLAAEELGLATSPYKFAQTEEEYRAAIAEIGGGVDRLARLRLRCENHSESEAGEARLGAGWMHFCCMCLLGEEI